MPKKADPEFSSIEAEQAWAALSNAAFHLKRLKAKDLAKEAERLAGQVAEAHGA